MASASASETFDDIWSDDLLKRKDDAEFLRRYLPRVLAERSSRGAIRSFVLNLDAGWGQGKTFFLDRFRRTLLLDGHLVAKVDAWRDDHADDPLLAIMAAIDDVLRSELKSSSKAKTAWQKARSKAGAVAVAGMKGALLQLGKKIAGDAVAEISQIIQDDSGAIESGSSAAGEAVKRIIDEQAELLVEGFREGKRSIDSFRQYLDSTLKELRKEREERLLFVIVDELDRCRPSYAIALIERAKHLFDVDGVVFVIATDTSQLQHSISAVYGAGFDSQKYLLRFFDRGYSFEEPAIGEFVAAWVDDWSAEALLVVPPEASLVDYLSAAIMGFGLSLRDAHQCLDMLSSIVTVWRDELVPIQLTALFPLIVLHHRKLLVSYNSPKIAEREMTSDSQFTFGYNEHGPVKSSISAIFTYFAVRSKWDLETLRREADRERDRTLQWVNQCVYEELVSRIKRTGDRGVRSYLGEYPALVRSVGRLTPRMDTPDG